MRRNQKNHKRRSTKLVQRPLIYTWYLPSNLLPSSFFLTSVTSVTSVERIRCRTSFFLTSVTSVTSVTESVAELPSSVN